MVRRSDYFRMALCFALVPFGTWGAIKLHQLLTLCMVNG